MTDQEKPKAPYTAEEYDAMLSSYGVTREFALRAVNRYLRAVKAAEVDRVSATGFDMRTLVSIIRSTDHEEALSIIGISEALARNGLSERAALVRANLYLKAQQIASEPLVHLIQWPLDWIEFDAALCGFVTFNNIPVSLIRNYAKRPYNASEVDPIKVAGMGGGESIDGDVIRIRLNQIFGPPGIGWSIVSAPGVSRVEGEPFVWKTKNADLDYVYVKAYAFFAQYAVRNVYTGDQSFVQVGPFTDGHKNQTFEAAGGGSLTTLVKEFARFMGCMDAYESTINSVLWND